MSGRLDPELDDLFRDPALRDVAHLMSQTRIPDVRPDPAFRSDLRRRLMQQAWTAGERRPSFLAGLFAPNRLAWAGAFVGVVLIALVGILMSHGGGGFVEVLPPTSPLDNAQQVSVVRPIELDFNQAMNHQSVEQAVQVSPATPLKFDWRGNSLFITPITGTLAPNTQYQVTLPSNTAKTVNDQAVTQAKVITFVTQPTPAPAPAATPTPSATPTPVTGERAIAPVGRQPAQWAPDSTTLYFVNPDGKLQSVPAPGGEPKTLADGVKVFAAAPSGPVFARAGDIQDLTAAGAPETLAAGANPIALGLRQGHLQYVDAKGLHAGTAAVVPLADTATAAWFSPGGERLAYQAASGLHLNDLAGHDSLVAGATAFLAWSPDGRRFAYRGADGLYAGSDGTTPLKISPLAASAVSWAQGDRMLVATDTGLSQVAADGTSSVSLATGEYGLPVWAPSGAMFAFVRAGQLFTANLTLSETGPVSALGETLKVVDGFLKARQAGDAAQAAGFLDAAGKDSFSDAALKPVRSFVILAQPGQATVRLVLGDKKDESAVDETLVMLRSPAGTLLIHKVTPGLAQSPGKGPEILSVQVTGNQLVVEFDSFLDRTAGQGAVLKDAAGKPVAVQAAVAARVLTLNVPGGLTSRAVYQLVVNGSLKDINGHPFVGEEAVPIIGS